MESPLKAISRGGNPASSPPVKGETFGAGAGVAAHETRDILASESFKLLVQRSDKVRVRLVLAVLFCLMILTCARRAAGGIVMNSEVFWWTLGVLVLAVGYECWMLGHLTRAIAKRCLITDRCRRINAALEMAIPFSLLTILQLLSPRGANRLIQAL